MTVLAWILLLSAATSAVVVGIDVTRVRRPRMTIMCFVWPLTMLWAGAIGLVLYFGVFRTRPHNHVVDATAVAVATTHCGSGCMLGDIVAESLTAIFPLTLFGSALGAAWTLDFALAFVFGIVFQYFSIAPMRHLGFREGIVAALKADTLSLVAWQVGMYGWMALVQFVFYAPGGLEKSAPVFWLMMQIAMFAGFATSYPVNRLLLKSGVKELM